MRVLAVTPSYPPCIGGAELLLAAVAKRLVDRGHEVSVYTTNGATHAQLISPGGGELPQEEIINGVRVRRFPPDRGVARALRWATRRRGGYRSARLLFGHGLKPALDRPTPFALLPALARARADVVLSLNWSWPPAYAVYLARRVRRLPLVGVPILHVGQPWALRPLYPLMLQACDGVLAMTGAEADFVRARGAVHPVVTGAGVDPGPFESRDGRSVRVRFGLGNLPVIGFIGRQDRGKGVPTLLGAMRRLWASGRDVRLLLAGQRAHRSREVTEDLNRLTEVERARVILFDDFEDGDRASILDACDIVVLPSVEESFGMVYLEAWLCGKPVVGARIPSTACVVADGEDGLLARPEDAADLSDGLAALLADPDRRRRMGQHGRAKTLANFTWDHVTDRWEAELVRVAAQVRPVHHDRRLGARATTP